MTAPDSIWLELGELRTDEIQIPQPGLSFDELRGRLQVLLLSRPQPRQCSGQPVWSAGAGRTLARVEFRRNIGVSK